MNQSNLVWTEGARSRSATPPRPAGRGFRVPPAKRAGALLVGAKTKKAGCLRNLPFMFWCPRRDSNPHTLRHMDLNHARLPIPPRGLGEMLLPKEDWHYREKLPEVN